MKFNIITYKFLKMQVYKFGGASVKSAATIRNLLNIIKLCDDNLVVIVSAMGKMTNAFEILLEKYLCKKEYISDFDKIISFHQKIIKHLFNENSKIHLIIQNIFSELNKILSIPATDNFDKNYDTIVSFGEILSTNIVSVFLNENHIENQWLDARKLIKTDSNFRNAKVDFQLTETNLKKAVDFNNKKIFLTQGFISSDKNNKTTTLGREGSDYTAAIIANILNAEKLTLWKDVEGIYNADPKLISNATKLEKISFREATELAYFGAKIIHPKTSKPLKNKNIKLVIRSFINYKKTGTIVDNFSQKISPLIPIIIYKHNQILLTISSKEFDFIDEYVFEKIFSILNKYKIKINLMQNSALNLSLCFDYNQNNFVNFLSTIDESFNYKYNKNLTLITIRHYTNDVIEKEIKKKIIKLEQKNNVNTFYLIES